VSSFAPPALSVCTLAYCARDGLLAVAATVDRLGVHLLSLVLLLVLLLVLSLVLLFSCTSTCDGATQTHPARRKRRYTSTQASSVTATVKG
jgi:hypothetical protein